MKIKYMIIMIYKIKIGNKIFETIETTIEKIPYFKNKFNDSDLLELNINTENFSNILDSIRYDKDLPLHCGDELIFLGLLENGNDLIEINVGGIKKNI